MSFSFTLSSDELTIAPGGSATLTITQTSSLEQPITYRLSGFVGGFDDCATCDEAEDIGYTFPVAGTGRANFAQITGNGTTTVMFQASDDAADNSTDVAIYGYIFTASGPNQPLTATAPLTLTIEA